MLSKIVKVSLDNPPSSFKASAEYFSLIPHESHGIFRKKLFDTKLQNRKKVWRGFNLPMKEVEKRFKKMTIERNKFAQKKGYSSYLFMFLDLYKIPQSDYKNLIKNTDKVINYCNQQLPKTESLPDWFYSEFNLPCFICRLPQFPFKTLDEVFDFVAGEYPTLKNSRHKIDITLSKTSEMIYKKETGIFKITLDKNSNFRHQAVDLIHELSHVISNLKNLTKGDDPLEKGAYLREKEATEIEFRLLERVNPKLYQAIFGEILLILRRVLFEIELYKNPDQNLSRLYAKTFNQCFKGAKQKDSPLWVLDERIVLRPLLSLPHAVAYAKILSEENKISNENQS